jgi:hypothetical protein
MNPLPPSAADIHPQSDLSEYLVVAVVEVMSRWFSAPKLSIKLGIAEPQRVEISDQEGPTLLREALHGPEGSRHLESMLRAFHKDRPKKDGSATWKAWKRGAEEIRIALGHAGLKCDRKGALLGPPYLPSQLAKELNALDPKLRVKEALREAGVHLQSFGPFEAKTAGDLLRATMEVIHRLLVQELEELYGKKCSGHDSDNERRQYMRAVGFISQAEEKVSNAIYSLVSEESAHQLLARTEVVLFVQSTVHNYLILLLRRLKAAKAQIGPT